MKKIDKEVLSCIQQLNNLKIKVSYRKIANMLNKQNSLRSIQLSIERLEANYEIIKENGNIYTLLIKEDDRIDLIINISLSELGKLNKLKELGMINFLIK